MPEKSSWKVQLQAVPKDVQQLKVNGKKSTKRRPFVIRQIRHIVSGKRTANTQNKQQHQKHRLEECKDVPVHKHRLVTDI